MNEVRVRFAPSPTGNLHVGGARTALFNWLFARKQGGRFILRIDDTDSERSSEQYFESITRALEWLGLDWDEGPGKGGPHGPYQQSQRLDLYREQAERLLAGGNAYRCYCTPEELERDRQGARQEGRAPRYSGRCSHLTPDQEQALRDEGRQPVLRLRLPATGHTVLRDEIRGVVSFNNEDLDDFIIVKSNGMPAYNFACVVDDIAMGITHVLRAEEHLSNTPRQVAIYEALAAEPPVFAHVPMILAPDRSKLSKRHGATSVEEFRDQGYLPEALVNYLVLLGWSPDGEQEFLSPEEMIAQFELRRVGKTASVYDLNKLTWMNGHYLREADLDRLTDLVLPFFETRGLVAAPLAPEDRARLRQVVGVVRDRVKTLAEVADAGSYFYRRPQEYDEKGLRKHFSKPGVAQLLQAAASRLEAVDDFTLEATEAAYRELAAELGLAAAALIHPTRLALSGRTVGPGLFDIMVTLGRQESVARLGQAAAFIQANCLDTTASDN